MAQPGAVGHRAQVTPRPQMCHGHRALLGAAGLHLGGVAGRRAGSASRALLSQILQPCTLLWAGTALTQTQCFHKAPKTLPIRAGGVSEGTAREGPGSRGRRAQARASPGGTRLSPRSFEDILHVREGWGCFWKGNHIPDVSQEPCPHGHEVRVPCSSCSGGHPSPCSCLLAFGSGHHHRSRSLCAIKGSQKEAKKPKPTQKCSVCLSRALAAGLHLETSRAALPPAIGIPGKATTKKKKNTRHLNYILI